MSPTNRNTHNPRPKARHAATHTRTPQQVRNVRGVGASPKGGSHASRQSYVGSGPGTGTTRKTPRSRTMDQQVASIPIERGEFVLTRRHFVYGGVTLAGILVVGGGAYAFNAITGEQTETIKVLDVDTSDVSTADSLDEVESTSCVSQTGDYQLTYGTLVWCNDDELAACLVPGDSGKPLNQVCLLELSSGDTSTVLEEAVGSEEGFEIIDVRATSSGAIWVETDMLEGTWRVYTAALSSGYDLGTPMLVDEGNGDWETPSIALVGANAFWQVLPNTDGTAAAEASLCKSARVGSRDSRTVWESTGRMATSPYASDKYVVITPRADADGSIHYQLVCLDAKTGDTVDTMTLPASMKPLDAGYSDNGFTFAFDSIYSNDTGIANLGTYAPAAKASGDSYSDVPWFRWARTPSCAPANCGNYLIVKSTSAVCGVNLKTETYFVLDVESGSEDYGDMLASSGSRDFFVTYANVTNKPLKGNTTQYCRVRVWAAS